MSNDGNHFSVCRQYIVDNDDGIAEKIRSDKEPLDSQQQLKTSVKFFFLLKLLLRTT